MNILIVSDNPIFILGLRSTIVTKFARAGFIEVSSLQAASIVIKNYQFNVMILDAVSAKDSKGVKLIQSIKEQHPGLPILVDLGNQLADSHFYIRLGVNAVVSNAATPAEIVQAVEVLASEAHKKFVSQDIEQLLLFQMTSNSLTGLLTKRERVIANLLISSKSRTEIARIAGINPNTVSAYKRTIFEKLDIQSVSELTLKLQPANRHN
ncbi:response regulator transcription factor [Dyadobacter sp. MSC1_007]|jgi:two-component system response regulator FimZ (fimbrial Z protein)|uniref:response regulator transcription factor n=1 Tax=Dyadobacter sp. MSC1_007 TaxID=2909264 RepID=UPI00202DD324|nr:response regulator transcription factor [Dyadobacter sp. MSC1_007]